MLNVCVAPVSELQASGIHLVGVQLLDSIVASCLNRGERKTGHGLIFTLAGVCYTKATGLCVFVLVCV